jgi:hypothetical protein
MLPYVAYFRSKLRCLPPTYREFIMRSLVPNGTIVIAECERRYYYNIMEFFNKTINYRLSFSEANITRGSA